MIIINIIIIIIIIMIKIIIIIIIIRAPFYEYLKLLKATRKERSRKKDSWSHLGIELGTFRTEGRELTSCANSPF